MHCKILAITPIFGKVAEEELCHGCFLVYVIGAFRLFYRILATGCFCCTGLFWNVSILEEWSNASSLATVGQQHLEAATGGVL